MKVNTMKVMSTLQIVLLFVSLFSFSFFLSEEFSFASAATDSSYTTRPLAGGGTVQVKNVNGRLTDSKGTVYVADSDGLLAPATAFKSAASSSATTSTPTPTNAPTSTPGTVFGAAPGAFGAGVGSPGSSAASDATGLLGTVGQFGSLLKGPIGEGLIWGGVVFGAATAITSVLGGSPALVESLGIAAGVGAFTTKFVKSKYNLSTGKSLLIGAGVGLLIFTLLYEEQKFEAVQFSCLPWQPPVGATSDICEKCNDETMPCSEYRCRSLGQTCELVNQGTDEERCVDVNPKDVKPPVITPDPEELTFGYKYDDVKLSPPGPGFKVVRMNGENDCVEAFTPLRFGIELDEPGQCKIDFNSTTTFSEMFSFMGGSNLFKYKHYEQFVLPHAKDFGNTSLQLENGKDLTFYIRCQDKRGNENEAEYAVSFCVDPSPDTTAPQIKATSIDSNSCIPATTDSAVIDFYTNEPAECKWSRDDQDFDSMQGEMSCTNQLYQLNALQLYTCQANLTGVTRELTDFYVRCRDQPNEENVNDRNTNQDSYRFSLRGSNQLKLRSIGPNGTIPGGVNPLPVDLTVETLFGCDKGVSSCYFSGNGEDGDYILFGNTDTQDGLHNQTLYLGSGEHEYHVRCVDSGGNLVSDSTKFFVDIDTSAPIIARIYNDAGQLKVVTLRDSECSYSHNNCDFLFDEGLPMPKDDSKVHFAEWNNEETYYIKCRDRFRDLTADCSAVIKPTKLFFE